MIIEKQRLTSELNNYSNDYKLYGDLVINFPNQIQLSGVFYIKSTGEQCGSFYYEEDDCPRFKEFYGVSEENLPKVTSLLNTTIENIKDLILNEYI